ncbi:MAG: GAF domain-containing protein [Anaerolineae bacterium]|nr:GAF domain-containing protein [Anaerolineae bacterium]
MSENNVVQRLSFLYEAARTLSSSLDIEQVLQVLMTLTQQHFQPDAVSVALVEADNSLVFRAASGLSARQVLGLRMAPGMGVVGWVAEHGETTWVSDTHFDVRHYKEVDEATGFDTRSIYAVPVKIGEQTLAVLEIINPKPDTDIDELQEVIPALTSIAATAIQNARLFEEVHRAEERYQRLFELNLDPIIILDKQGKLLHVNQAGQHLRDLLEDTGGNSLLDALGVPQEALVEGNMHPNGGSITTWEFEIATGEENARIYEVSLAYLAHYPPDGAYQVLAHDVTDRVALEKMREMLSHMIVHDLRNPLNNITYSLELLRTSWLEQDTALPIDQIVKIGIRNARRMDQLISDILDAARLPQDSSIAVACNDVADLVQEAIETVLSLALRRGQNLTSDIPDALPQLEGDYDLLQRVLINLLGNAVKFTLQGGDIHTCVWLTETEFVFSVRDTGPGISPEEQPHIFDPFYQGKEGKGKRRGAGLGLAFCKLAVEAHQGRIWLESVLGEGTTFYFSIPRILPETVKRRVEE